MWQPIRRVVFDGFHSDAKVDKSREPEFLRVKLNIAEAKKKLNLNLTSFPETL